MLEFLIEVGYLFLSHACKLAHISHLLVHGGESVHGTTDDIEQIPAPLSNQVYGRPSNLRPGFKLVP